VTEGGEEWAEALLVLTKRANNRDSHTAAAVVVAGRSGRRGSAHLDVDAERAGDVKLLVPRK
jgi:hypothetical protein